MNFWNFSLVHFQWLIIFKSTYIFALFCRNDVSKKNACASKGTWQEWTQGWCDLWPRARDGDLRVVLLMKWMGRALEKAADFRWEFIVEPPAVRAMWRRDAPCPCLDDTTFSLTWILLAPLNCGRSGMNHSPQILTWKKLHIPNDAKTDGGTWGSVYAGP